jgi:hypothetical protein
MSPELEKKLIEKYPELYDYKSEDGKSSEISCYGFNHGDGWFNIIDCLSATITDAMRNHPGKKHLSREEFNEKVQVRVAQVKEKFGTLRFYVNNGNREISSVIILAEMLSGRTCEYCGCEGTRRGGGWVKTLCDSCVSKKKENAQ